MNISDPIADMLVRLKNANEVRDETVDIPHSKMKESIAEVLEDEGFIEDYRVYEKQFRPNKEPQKVLRVYMKYTPKGEKVLRNLERVSKPGRRVYSGVDEFPRVLDGLGVLVVSTSKGVMSDREAKKLRLGGELLCKVW